MPFYEYEVIEPDGEAGEHFEVFQKMADPPLTEHPETGKPVRRVIGAPFIASKYTERSTREMLSDKNLDKMGFTKYVKSGDGSYEKTTGKGPDSLNRQE